MNILYKATFFILSLATIHLCAAEDFNLDNPFYIPSEKVIEIKSQTGLSTEELLQKLVPIASKYARPLISNYRVGSAVLTGSGAIYLGVNLEFLGVSLNQSVHSEQFAITNARNHGETEIVAIAISASPCGHCRQFMNEMGCESPLRIIICGSREQALTELLPQSFGPADLGITGGFMTMKYPNRAFTMDYSTRTLGLMAAYRSYAPYTKSLSGVALQTADGTIYAGSYIENAAFNPSLSPLQVALVALVSDLRQYDEIRSALLIENPLSPISHESSTRSVLKGIAPSVNLRILQNKLD